MDKCPETLRFPPSHHFVVFFLNNVYIKKGLTHYIGMLYNAVFNQTAFTKKFRIFNQSFVEIAV